MQILESINDLFKNPKKISTQETIFTQAQTICQTFLFCCFDSDSKKEPSETSILPQQTTSQQKKEFTNPFTPYRNPCSNNLKSKKILNTNLNYDNLPVPSTSIEKQQLKAKTFSSELTPPQSPLMRSTAPSPQLQILRHALDQEINLLLGFNPDPDPNDYLGAIEELVRIDTKNINIIRLKGKCHEAMQENS
jgi:hypothetical protein